MRIVQAIIGLIKQYAYSTYTIIYYYNVEAGFRVWLSETCRQLTDLPFRITSAPIRLPIFREVSKDMVFKILHILILLWKL